MTTAVKSHLLPPSFPITTKIKYIDHKIKISTNIVAEK